MLCAAHVDKIKASYNYIDIALQRENVVSFLRSFQAAVTER